MQRFLLKAVCFIALQACIFFAFWNPSMPKQRNYLAATIDKHSRLKKNHPRRILLVGGSNVAFGIDSSQLKEATGREVFNMSLTASLGTHFMLNEVRPYLQTNDLVVLSFEYDLLHGLSDASTQQKILQFRPSLVTAMNLPNLKKVAGDQGLFVMSGLARRMLNVNLRSTALPDDEDGFYFRGGFDAAGCYTNHYSSLLNLPQKGGAGEIKVLGLSAEIKKELQSFVAYCQYKGATCVFTCAPHPLGSIKDYSKAHDLVNQLGNIPGLKVIDMPENQAQPEEMFYDTMYHLTKEGATIRTRKLIQFLGQ